MPRWTIQILGELWGGASRFNEIKRGLPGISPTLLTKRLKEMQDQGLLERVEDKATGAIDYFRTDKAAGFVVINVIFDLLIGCLISTVPTMASITCEALV